MLVALLLSLQTVAAPRARGDVLDELIAKTSQLKSFTADYEMTFVATDVTPPTTRVNQMHIEYLAPDKMRLDMSTASDHGSQWLVGGVLALKNEGEKPINVRIDMRAIAAEFAHADRVLEEAFPGAKSPSGEPGSVLVMSWSFDERAQKANFSLTLVDDRASRTPLGWLTDLRDKDEKSSDSGTQLLFDNDGHIKVAISKRSGFVESFSSKSPHGEMRLQLKSLETDDPIDPQRFVLPSAPSGEVESAADMRAGMFATRAMACRFSTYREIAGTAGGQWTDAQRSKIATVMRAVHEPILNAECKDLREWEQKRGVDVATWLHRRLDDGHSEDEVARDRDAQIQKLDESLDKKFASFSSLFMTVPEHSPPFPRGEELLKLEREVATKAFDELVRAPIVHDFEQATSLEKK